MAPELHHTHTLHHHPNKPVLPKFGGHNGFIYPFVAHTLAFCTRFTIPRLCNLHTTLTDLYISVCLFAVVAAAIVAEFMPDCHWCHTGICIFVAWRLYELSAISLFEFCCGSYRGKTEFRINRILTLKIVNLIELILLFGICYYLPGKAGYHWMNHSFEGVFEAIYFSSVTAGTLGYGDYVPTHWFLRVLAMYEVLFFVMIGVSILGVLRSRAPMVIEKTD